MNEREQQALAALLQSKNARAVCPETVKRLFVRALSRYKTVKEADKATRETLHGLTFAFLSPADERAAAQCLDAYRQGDESALLRALSLHASTRERLADDQALYERVFRTTGRPRAALDLACGLNPLCLGAMGVPTLGLDISLAAVRTVNAWADCGLPIQARPFDLAAGVPDERAELALLMKLLPLLERDARGAAMRLLTGVDARFKLVTFPTKTLSGREVGMTAHYEDWFRQQLPDTLRVLDRFVQGTELCFVLG